MIGYTFYRMSFLYRVSTFGHNEISQLRLANEVCQAANPEMNVRLPTFSSVTRLAKVVCACIRITFADAV